MKKLVVPMLLVAVFASMMIPAGFAWKTPGYWKNRGYDLYGPYPDNIWDAMEMEDGTPLTGALAFEVLWMDKSTGDATKILAFQLIAAILNVEILNVYVYPCMQEVIDGGLAALAAAGGIGADPEPGALRDDCIYYAELLDLINNDMYL